MPDAPWLAFHVYAEEPEEVLSAVVRPALDRLAADGSLDELFFVRYGDRLGRHVRLRVRADRPGEAVEALVRRLAGERLCRREAFEPEVERYGGCELLPLSLSFFALSSLHALVAVDEWAGVPRERRLGRVLTALLRQACGLAATPEELLFLLDYYYGQREAMQPLADKGRAVFEAQRALFTGLVRDELERQLAAEPELPVPTLDALALQRGLAAAPRRRGIAMSQMHMTSNRLGLANAEELYLTEILVRAGRAAAGDHPELWRRLGEALRHRAAASGPSPSERLAERLAALRPAPPPRPAGPLPGRSSGEVPLEAVVQR